MEIQLLKHVNDDWTAQCTLGDLEYVSDYRTSSERALLALMLILKARLRALLLADPADLSAKARKEREDLTGLFTNTQGAVEML